MFDDLKIGVYTHPVKVFPAIAGRLNLDEIRKAWDRTQTQDEFLLDPYVNPNYRVHCAVNAGMTSKAQVSSFIEWVHRIHPGGVIHRDETLSQGDLLDF